MSAEAERDIARIKALAEGLSEHFDTVQIFATRHEPAVEDGTLSFQFGLGNWYARYGHIRTWMVRQDERSRCEQRNDDKF